VERGQGEECDERDAGHAVGFNPSAVVRRVAGVVTGAIRDDAGILRFFRELEHDLHQVGADVAILVKMPRKYGRTEAPRDSPMAKPMKQGPRVRGQEHQDANHEEQFHADQSKPTLMPERRGSEVRAGCPSTPRRPFVNWTPY